MSAPEITSHRLGPVAAIPLGEGRAYAVDGLPIAVFRLRGEPGEDGVRALHAVCPHAGGPLADGQADPVKVVCPLHNYAFSVADGSCLNGDFAVRTYPARVQNGEIVVDLYGT